MDARSLPMSPRDRRMAARAGREFTTTAHTALAEVAIEGGGVVEGDIAGGEVDDLRSASAGEDESEDDGEVRLPLRVSGMTWRSCCTWEAERPLGALGRGLGRSTGSQGLEAQIESDEELEEGRDAGEASADGYGEGSRPERPMPWAKLVLKT